MAREKPFKPLLDAIGAFPFDICIFAEHAPDDEQGGYRALFCARMVFGPDGAAVPWPGGWRPVTTAMEKLARTGTPWISNLVQYSVDPSATSKMSAGSKDRIHLLIDLGIQSLSWFVIYEGDRVIASVTLGSRSTGAYGEAELNQLPKINIEGVMRTLLENRKHRFKKIAREAATWFRPTLPPDELAAYLVKVISSELNADFVGIYRVATSFMLVARTDKTPNQLFRIDTSYRQPLSDGMLGETLRRKVCLRADDVTVTPPPFGYVRMDGFPAQSALCYPIEVRGRIEWILDCESTALASFHGPDREFLDDLVAKLQSTLDLWFEYQLSASILDGLDQAVLVLDRDGMIQRANQRAREFLGLPPGEISTPLAEFAADEPSKLILSSPGKLLNATITLRTAHNRTQSALANARLSRSAFSRWILQLNEIDESSSEVNLRYARGIVAEVAADTHGPLLLASALISRVHKSIQHGTGNQENVRDLERALECIARANISYERIARSIAGKDQFMLKSLLSSIKTHLATGAKSNYTVDFPISNDLNEVNIRGDIYNCTVAFTSLISNMSGEVKVTPRYLADSEFASLTIIGLESNSMPMNTNASVPNNSYPEPRALLSQDDEPVWLITNNQLTYHDLDDFKLAIGAEGGSVSIAPNSIDVHLPIVKSNFIIEE